MTKSLPKEKITESDLVEGGDLVIENIKWGGTDRSTLKNAQRIIEDMMDVSVPSRVRVGCGITTGGDITQVRIAAGNLCINGRWLRVTANEDFTIANLSGSASNGDRIVVVELSQVADNWEGGYGNRRNVELESFYLREIGADSGTTDNQLALATYTRTSDDISSIVNVNTPNVPESRFNHLIAKTDDNLVLKTYKGTELLTLTPSLVTIHNPLDIEGALDVSGNIVVGGTVDAVDVSLLKSDFDTLDTDVDGFPDRLKYLEETEILELENIGAITIDEAQWGRLGELDQSVKIGANVNFGVVTADSFGVAVATSFTLAAQHEETRSIQPFDFRPNLASSTYESDGSGKLVCTTSPSAVFSVGLNIPNGALLTDVMVRGSNGGDTVQVTKVQLLDGDTTILMTESVETLLNNIDEEVYNGTYAYKILVSITQNDKIYGAFYKYKYTTIKS